MRHSVLGAAFAVFTFGCGSSTPSTANSFTTIYAEIIQPKCSNDFCHFNGVSIRFSALDLSSQVRAYWSLVDQPSLGPNCQQRGTRVVPWQPEASIMYLKVSQDNPPCGVQMPADATTFSTNGTSELKFSGPALPADQQRIIHDWIQEGAQNN